MSDSKTFIKFGLFTSLYVKTAPRSTKIMLDQCRWAGFQDMFSCSGYKLICGFGHLTLHHTVYKVTD